MLASYSLLMHANPVASSLLPHTTLIASAPFDANSIFNGTTGLSYFGMAVDSALEELINSQSISFSQLAADIQRNVGNEYSLLVVGENNPEPLSNLSDGTALPSDLSSDIFSDAISDFDLELASVPEASTWSMIR